MTNIQRRRMAMMVAVKRDTKKWIYNTGTDYVNFEIMDLLGNAHARFTKNDDNIEIFRTGMDSIWTARCFVASVDVSGFNKICYNGSVYNSATDLNCRIGIIVANNLLWPYSTSSISYMGMGGKNILKQYTWSADRTGTWEFDEEFDISNIDDTVYLMLFCNNGGGSSKSAYVKFKQIWME